MSQVIDVSGIPVGPGEYEPKLAAQTPQALREALEIAQKYIEGFVRLEQNTPDHPPEHADQQSYEADMVLCEISKALSATPMPVPSDEELARNHIAYLTNNMVGLIMNRGWWPDNDPECEELEASLKRHVTESIDAVARQAAPVEPLQGGTEALEAAEKKGYTAGYNAAATKIGAKHTQELDEARKRGENNPVAEARIEELTHQNNFLISSFEARVKAAVEQDVARELARLSALPVDVARPVVGWRPMNTAPKNEWIILLEKDGQAASGMWSDGDGEDLEPGWFSEQDEEVELFPVGWMPNSLPAAPTAANHNQPKSAAA